MTLRSRFSSNCFNIIRFVPETTPTFAWVIDLSENVLFSFWFLNPPRLSKHLKQTLSNHYVIMFRQFFFLVAFLVPLRTMISPQNSLDCHCQWLIHTLLYLHCPSNTSWVKKTSSFLSPEPSDSRYHSPSSFFFLSISIVDLGPVFSKLLNFEYRELFWASFWFFRCQIFIQIVNSLISSEHPPLI